MALPSNLSYCLVTGRFLRAVGDGGDGDELPEGIAVSGLSIKFSSDVEVLKNPTESVTILVSPITCTTDASGYLIGPDGSSAGVYLIATDDPDLDPINWTWTVTLSGTDVPPIKFSFAAPSGGTVDLTTLIPVPASPGIVDLALTLVQSLTIRHVEKITQAQYNDLPTPRPETTLYVIV